MDINQMMLIVNFVYCFIVAFMYFIDLPIALNFFLFIFVNIIDIMNKTLETAKIP